MRITISLPVVFMERLHALARREYRDPKQQAESILCRVLEQEMRDHPAPEAGETAEVAHVPAGQS